MTDRPRNSRTLLIPDHVWVAYEQMAADMGGDRDALVSQALFAFARMNGYLVPSDLQRLGLSAPPPASEVAAPVAQPAPVEPPARPPAPVKAAVRPAPVVEPSPATILLEPESPANARRAAANPQRMAEIERQLQSAPPPARAAGPARAEPVEVDDALLGDDSAQATSMDLPTMRDLAAAPERAPIGRVAVGARAEAAPRADSILVISSDGRELDRVVKERFLIGRGKHCDLIINSGKVSREHAAITREGTAYFIEDLGSSNGTWFDKRRITKRQIEAGDDYYICAEKLSCSFNSNG